MNDQPKEKVNMKDEIIKLLKNYNFNDKSRRFFDPYKAVANDIIALFEVEGEAKVEYLVQYKFGDWGDLHGYKKTKEGAIAHIKKERKRFCPRNPDLYCLIKRTTIDQTIEE